MTAEEFKADVSTLPPITANVVMQIGPLTYAFEHDLQDLSHRLAEWFVSNVTKFTDPRGADLFALVQLTRGEEHAGTTYRDGHFVKPEGRKDDPTV